MSMGPSPTLGGGLTVQGLPVVCLKFCDPSTCLSVPTTARYSPMLPGDGLATEMGWEWRWNLPDGLPTVSIPSTCCLHQRLRGRANGCSCGGGGNGSGPMLRAWIWLGHTSPFPGYPCSPPPGGNRTVQLPTHLAVQGRISGFGSVPEQCSDLLVACPTPE